MRSNLRTWLGGCLTSLALASLPVHPQTSDTSPVVSSANASAAASSALIYSASFRHSADFLAGVDPEFGFARPSAIIKIRQAGISLIRYPASDLANTFHWQRSVGPQNRRGLQAGGMAGAPAPQESRFGPDEYGDLLDKTGTSGELVVNFGTGTAAEAADFVAYMAHPIGGGLVNGVDWAARRAANHHPPAYPIAYVDVGMDLGAPADERGYWMQGVPVSINAACAADKISCLYAFGGATRFEKQPAVLPADWRDGASLSNGDPQQSLYARYAPVAAGSEIVMIDGAAWQGLSDLASAAADAKVYTIDYQSGAVSFGDGVHGAIPPKGSRVSLTYTSGHHDGFVDYYRAIKAVNPKIKVCAAVQDESFIRIMGAQHLYDCLQQQAGGNAGVGPPQAGGNAAEFSFRIAQATPASTAAAALTQQRVNQHAGANAPKVQLVLTD